MIFACMPAYGGDEREAILLAQSIRRFGGQFAQSDILILTPETTPLSEDARSMASELGVSIVPFTLPDSVLDFPFAQKVYAAAAAEKLVGGELLVWMDSDTLVLRPPLEFMLPQEKRIGCCAVHLRNISTAYGEKANPFWQTIYDACGTKPEQVFFASTTVDNVKINAQFNAGLLVVRPGAGLLRTWRENFEQLYGLPNLQPFYLEDRRYKIFAHQAILSATLLARFSQEEVNLFSSQYNLPIFLQERFRFPVSRPVTCRYDSFDWLTNSAWSCGEPETNARLKEMITHLVGLV